MDTAPAHRRIWIVDDSPLEAEMARQALSSSFATRVFSDGAAAMEQLGLAAPPDVLVLDWVMPGLSGIEVCQFLRTREQTSELAILLLTAKNQTQQIVEGLAAGANDFLTKPYSPAELAARVHSLVRARALRERAEAAERSMRALLAHLPDALITTRATGEITFLNAEAERVLATSSAAAKGRPLGEVIPALAAIHRSPPEGEHFETLPELELGSSLYAPAVQTMPIDGDETIVVTLRDVTEKRRLEKRRLDFYSMVAHDLRAPLAAMTLRVGQMRKGQHGPLGDGYRRDLEMVDSRIGELVRLINDFLELASSEGVGLKLVRQPVDLVAVVRESLADLKELAELSGVTIRFEEPAVAAQTVADPVRLRQVITNLISNAVKFSSSGGQVLVEVGRRDREVEVAISDAGRGIAEDKISALFRRYSRPSGDGAPPATELGLLIVREIVAAHSGTCGVESTLGKGSRFWFRLPHLPR